jgi:hypothetical protein
MDAAKDDHLSIGSGRLATQLKGISCIISNILDFRTLIVMGKDNCVEFLF